MLKMMVFTNWTNDQQNTKQKTRAILSTIDIAQAPASLDMIRKSKAKPIMPPAAHQCPRSAATVGSGKQQILRTADRKGEGVKL